MLPGFKVNQIHFHLQTNKIPAKEICGRRGRRPLASGQCLACRQPMPTVFKQFLNLFLTNKTQFHWPIVTA